MNMTVEDLLVYCNRVRTAGGADTIDALQPGIARSSKACLIARNLNFECKVQCAYLPLHGGAFVGGMFSDDPRLPAIGEAMGWKYRPGNIPFTVRQRYTEGYTEQYYPGQAFLELPDELTEAAIAFDRYEFPTHLYSGRA